MYGVLPAYALPRKAVPLVRRSEVTVATLDIERSRFVPPPTTPLKKTDERPPDTHETAAVLRAHREGASSAVICRELGMSKQQLVHELELAMADEREAHRLGMTIVGSGLPEDEYKRKLYLQLHGGGV